MPGSKRRGAHFMFHNRPVLMGNCCGGMPGIGSDLNQHCATSGGHIADKIEKLGQRLQIETANAC